MVGGVVNAKSAEEAASVSTGGDALGARSAEVQASVSTGGNAVNARSAEGAVSVSTGSVSRRRGRDGKRIETARLLRRSRG